MTDALERLRRAADDAWRTATPLASLQQHVSASLRPGEEFLAGIRVEVPEDGRSSRDAAFGIDRTVVDATCSAHNPDLDAVRDLLPLAD